MRKSTINETYYAIRIGDPCRHECYLAREDGMTPVLFNTREDAKKVCGNEFSDVSLKVVRVKIRCG